MPPSRPFDGPPDRSSDGASGSSGTLRRKGEADAWSAMSLVVSGVLLWGGVGALVGAWLDSGIPVMVGLLVGMFAGLYLVWFRYGRA